EQDGTRILRCAPLALASLLLVAAGGAAPGPLAELRADLDGDGRDERLHVEADGALHVEDSTGREVAAVPLGAPLERLSDYRLVTLEVEGHRVAHLTSRIATSRQSVEVVLQLAGAVQVLFSGRTGPVGDGERVEKLRLGPEGLVVFQTS